MIAKKLYGFWKLNKYMWNIKKVRLPDYLLYNYFYSHFAFRYYYYYYYYAKFSFTTSKFFEKPSKGVSAALGQLSFLKKYERKNLESFTWSRESNFGNIYPSLTEKIRFPIFKKKLNFLLKVFMY